MSRSSDDGSRAPKAIASTEPDIGTSKHLGIGSAKLWYSNAIFFVGTHIAACLGVYKKPVWDVPRATLLLAFVTFQAAEFGYVVIRTPLNIP